MLAPYRAVLGRPGALAFTAAAFVGRMYLSMVPLGIVLLVSAQTHRYGLAGAVSAVVSFVGAVTGPLFGRLVDRLGQRRVLLPALAIFAAGLVTLVALALSDAPRALLFVAALPTGVAAPALSSLVRARWAALLGPGRDLETAYALESVLDEVVFMAGPVLATVLATGVTPSAGLLAALVLTAIGTLSFAAQRGTEPPPSPRTGSARAGALGVPGMRIVAAAYVAIGMLFGSFDVTMVGFASRQGDRAAAGWLLALIAAGSLTGGLWYGARRWQATLGDRFTAACAVLTVCSVPLALAPSIPLMAGAALLTGLAIAPSLIASALLTERLVPAAALTEGLTLLGGSIGVGFALGAPLAGHLVDVRGPHAAFLVGVAAAAVGSAITIAGRRTLQPDRFAASPAAEPVGEAAGRPPGRLPTDW